ncbi:MAG: InlB B-repeat-containing protein [Treponema sp.]
MKKSNSTQKAQSAFKKLGAVALITATLAMFFTACNQTGGGKPKPTPKPKHAITFSVEGTNGTLKAKADGVDETSTSPINVEAGKTVTFTATANSGYRVKGWTLDGNAITEAGTNTEHKLKVSKPATVKVSFEAIPPTKYTVTLNQMANGNVTASPAIPQDGKVDENTEITFTAEAKDGYKIGKWTVTGSALEAGTGTDGSSTAKVKITADTTVSVSFEANSNPPTPQTKYTVTLNQTEHGKVTASPEIPEDKKVLKDTEITFTAKANDGYKIGTWTVLPSSAIKSGGGKGETTATLKITADTTVSVSFEAIPEGAILTLATDKNIVSVTAKTKDGSAITVEGCTEQTLANGVQTELHATGTRVVLKGKITELDCKGNQLTALNVQGLTALQSLNCSNNQLTALNVQGLTVLQSLNCSKNQLTELNVQGLTNLQELKCNYNQLTALNVQGCTSLQKLNCDGNQLSAKAMTELLNALPAREASDKAWATLYTEESGDTEGNCKDFTKPAELKAAFDGAKKRNWKLEKINASGTWEHI